MRTQPDATEPVVELLTAAAGDADTVKRHLDRTRTRLLTGAVDRLLDGFVAAGLWDAAESLVAVDRASDDALAAVRDRAGEAGAPPRLLAAVDAARDAAPAWSYALGRALLEAGRPDVATAALEAALARQPDDPE